jgi:hypothetical protein
MATSDVLSLFGNMPTQEQVADQFLSGMMVGPGQMAQLSMPQQIIANMRNAGANIGYAGGRMLGGATTDMIRAQAAEQIMKDISAMNFTSDADMYGELSRRLAQAGMSQDALKARGMALDARRTEQTMRLNEQQDKRAQAELKMREELHPLNKSKTVLEIQRLEDSMKPLEQQIAEEQAKDNPNPSKIEGLTRALQTEKDKVNMEKQKLDAQLKHWKVLEQQQASTLELQKARFDLESYSKPAYVTITSPNPLDMGKKVNVAVGWINPKTGKIMGQDGNIYDSSKAAAESQGMTAQEQPVRPGPVAQPTQSGNRPPLSSLYNQ